MRKPAPNCHLCSLVFHPTLIVHPFPLSESCCMAAPYLANLDGFPSTGLDGPVTPGGEGLSSRRTNALSTKLTSVLSSSYADYEIRGALRLLDERGVQNDEETRRNLKWNAQKEVIDANAKIVDDFGQVAEVCLLVVKTTARHPSLKNTLDSRTP